jgi:hypothetical protein
MNKEGPVLPATFPQIRAIYSLALGFFGADEEAVDDTCRQRYGCTPSGLSRRSASAFIDDIKNGAVWPRVQP